MEINVPVKISRKKTEGKLLKKPEEDLEGYSEIPAKDLIFFLGTWIKYYDFETKKYYNGGNLIEILVDSAVVTAPYFPKNERLQLNLETNIFYCKTDTPHYRSYTEIQTLRKELEYEKTRLNQEKSNLKTRIAKFKEKLGKK